MPNRRTYAERLLAGEAVSLDDEIDAWHESKDPTPPLHEWLGLSWHEYALLVTGKPPGAAEPQRRES